MTDQKLEHQAGIGSTAWTMPLLAAAVFMLPATLFAGEGTMTATDIVKTLSGRWTIDEGYNQGRELTDADLKGNIVMFDKNYIVTYDKDENEMYRASYTINTSTDPIQIDMTSKMEGAPPAMAMGILKIEKDDDETEWTLAYGLPGSERPKTFKSPKGSKVMCFEMEPAEK